MGFFEARAANFENGILAFLKRDELLTYSNAAASLLGHIFFGRGYLLLKETGGNLKLLLQFLLVLILLDKFYVRKDVLSLIFLMDSSKKSCSESRKCYF